MENESVSLFTREWIEIRCFAGQSPDKLVSLFTREWIEIAHDKRLYKKMLSPSLRGSGLKS